MDLQKKLVLVTGASGGLGEQICYQAAKKGAIVIACARRYEVLKTVTERCQQLSGQPAYPYQLNVADYDSVERVVSSVTEKFGTIDVLVNNAGFGIFEEFLDFDLNQSKKMFEVNVLGMMTLTQKFAVGMVDKGQGHIINIASMAGKMATAKSTVYSATKFAVLGFSNALRLELKPLGVHVTVVNPGPIATDFFSKADASGDYLEKIDAIVLQPDKLAKKIVATIEHPKREINQPYVMELAARCYTLFPHVGDFLAGSIFNKK